MARQADPEDSVRGLSSIHNAGSHAKEEELKSDFLDPETPMKVVPLSIGVGRAAWPQVSMLCQSCAARHWKHPKAALDLTALHCHFYRLASRCALQWQGRHYWGYLMLCRY